MITRPHDPVYPHPDEMNKGITLREYFAAQALPGYSYTHSPEQAAALALRAGDALVALLNGATPAVNRDDDADAYIDLSAIQSCPEPSTD